MRLNQNQRELVGNHIRKLQPIYFESICVKEDLTLFNENPKFFGKGKLYLPRIMMIAIERHFGVHNLKISLTHINRCLNSGYDPSKVFSNQDLISILKIAS